MSGLSPDGQQLNRDSDTDRVTFVTFESRVYAGPMNLETLSDVVGEYMGA